MSKRRGKSVSSIDPLGRLEQLVLDAEELALELYGVPCERQADRSCVERHGDPNLAAGGAADFNVLVHACGPCRWFTLQSQIAAGLVRYLQRERERQAQRDRGLTIQESPDGIDLGRTQFD